MSKVVGPKKDATGVYRKLHNEELHGLCSSPNIIQVIQWVGARGTYRGAKWYIYGM
jgi:hypothetical protein